MPATTLEVAHLVTISAYEPRILPICRIVTSQPVVPLTFDDGPDATFTPAILDLLEQNDARATSFLIGSRLEENADLVSREPDAGMELGNHTWSHTSLPSVPRRTRSQKSNAHRRHSFSEACLLAWFERLSARRPPTNLPLSSTLGCEASTGAFPWITW